MFAMISVSAGYGTEGSRTPTTVALREPRRIVLPTTLGSLLSDVVQNRFVEHGDAGGVGAIVRRTEQAPEDRPQPHDLEERPIDDAGANHARLAEADQRELDGRELAEGADRSSCDRKSLISGTEKVVFALPMPGRWRM